MEDKKTRIGVVLNQKSMDNLHELSELIRDKNMTAIIASSLAVAKEMMKYVKSGKQVILRDKDGSEKEVNFIIA